MGRHKTKSQDTHITQIDHMDGFDKSMIVVLTACAAVIPLLLRMHSLKMNEQTSRAYNGESSYLDIFNYLKAQWLIVALAVMALYWIVRFLQKRYISTDRVWIPFGVYTLFVVLSSLFSPYRWIAMNGFPDRLEGVFVLLSYVMLTLTGAMAIRTDKARVIIISGTMVSGMLLAALGASQYLGKDFLQTTIGKSLFIPDAYAVMFDKLTFNFGANIMYVTVYNSNYLGSYSALLLPIAVMLLFYWLEKKSILSVLGFLFIGANFILWLGGMSRAGLLGGIFAILFMFILGIRSLLQHWKATALIVLMCAILFSGMDNLSKGAVTREFRRTLPAAIESRLPKQKTSWNPFLIPVYADSGTLAEEKTVSSATTIPEPVPVSAAPTATKPAPAGKPLVLAVTLESNLFRFETETEVFVAMYADGAFIIRDGQDQVITYTVTQKEDENGSMISTITFNDERYSRYTMQMVSGGLLLKWYGHIIPLIVVDDELTVNTKPGVYESSIEKPEAIGFEGNENLASNRGYIWSRSLPILKQTLFLGKGPDTFATLFPQNDIAGKINWLRDNNMIVDKPHNWYLQMGINTGVPSLLAMLVFLAWYLLRGIRVKNEPALGDGRLIHIGILSGVVGYLVAAMFNDSNVSVSPVFWVMLGLGLSYVITANQVRSAAQKSSESPGKSSSRSSAKQAPKLSSKKA